MFFFVLLCMMMPSVFGESSKVRARTSFAFTVASLAVELVSCWVSSFIVCLRNSAVTVFFVAIAAQEGAELHISFFVRFVDTAFGLTRRHVFLFLVLLPSLATAKTTSSTSGSSYFENPYVFAFLFAFCSLSVAFMMTNTLPKRPRASQPDPETGSARTRFVKIGISVTEAERQEWQDYVAPLAESNQREEFLRLFRDRRLQGDLLRERDEAWLANQKLTAQLIAVQNELGCYHFFA